MNPQLATVLVLLFGVLLGAAGFHVVFMLGMKALGIGRVLGWLARRHPQEYVDNCPECQAFADSACTCTELVHDFDDEGRAITEHQLGCPRMGKDDFEPVPPVNPPKPPQWWICPDCNLKQPVPAASSPLVARVHWFCEGCLRQLDAPVSRVVD